MNTQLKKGLLEVCVLKVLSEEPSYGYKIINDVSEHIEISESTLYPILKRLEKSGCVTTYTENHNNRLRKYYQMTAVGYDKMEEFRNDYRKLDEVIQFILGGNEDE